MRADFGNLSNDSQIDMGNVYIGLLDVFQNRVQQHSRIDIVECRIGIREECSDIPAPIHPSKASINACSKTSPSEWASTSGEPAMGTPQPHRPGRLSRFIAISILMDIIPVTDTRDTLSCHPQHFQILGRSNFFVSRFSLRDMHGVSAQFKQTGVVSDNPAFLFRTLMGSPQKSEGKTLRGLNRHQMFPIRCGNDLFFFIHHFNGIHHGNAGDTCGDTFPEASPCSPSSIRLTSTGETNGLAASWIRTSMQASGKADKPFRTES